MKEKLFKFINCVTNNIVWVRANNTETAKVRMKSLAKHKEALITLTLTIIPVNLRRLDVEIEDRVKKILLKHIGQFEPLVIPKIAEVEKLHKLCKTWFNNPMMNGECIFCGAIQPEKGEPHHSAGDCPVIKYQDIISNFSE